MQPDDKGYFGNFGGRYVPELLIPALEELAESYSKIKQDLVFNNELSRLLQVWAGRPTPLYSADRLSEEAGGGVKIYLKREDLLHTGAHKVNNALGQGLLAQKMGKKRIVAETGAGQHGVASASVCAALGLECVIFMGEEDIKRQAPNVSRMKLLGAQVRPVSYGSMTLKEAVTEAFRFWVTHIEDTHYLLGSVVGPHPYPLLVRDLQSVIGRETREQILEEEGRFPHKIVASVGGGSNAMGIFHPFVEESEVELIGVEAGGEGLNNGRHSASVSAGSLGVLHGSRSSLLQDEHGFILPTHSISAGLDYPGVGPEHSYLQSTGRASYTAIDDDEALDAVKVLSRTEGIIPALESAHALAYVLKTASSRASVVRKDKEIIVVNLSGRGDKDMGIITERMEVE